MTPEEHAQTFFDLTGTLRFDLSEDEHQADDWFEKPYGEVFPALVTVIKAAIVETVAKERERAAKIAIEADDSCCACSDNHVNLAIAAAIRGREQ